jgi:hypothetical protein
MAKPGAEPADRTARLRGTLMGGWKPPREDVYDREPDVIAQFAPGEEQVRFEAEWTDEGWKFGKHVDDA